MALSWQGHGLAFPGLRSETWGTHDYWWCQHFVEPDPFGRCMNAN